MNYLAFVVLIVPVLIGLVVALLLGPNQGTLMGSIITIVAVPILLLAQVTPPSVQSA